MPVRPRNTRTRLQTGNQVDHLPVEHPKLSGHLQQQRRRRIPGLLSIEQRLDNIGPVRSRARTPQNVGLAFIELQGLAQLTPGRLQQVRHIGPEPIT
jgi:hypothetical protein